MPKPTQWHPLFAHLLRPVVQPFYEVETNVPVGDVPREADLVLLRKKTASAPSFRGIWQRLTTWSILEYKSPEVTPEITDIDLLVELGLGIQRRLNEQRTMRGLKRHDCGEVSFWYLANRLGRRFLDRCSRRIGTLEPAGAGIWRAQILERQIFLVSNADLPIDAESLPLHLVSFAPHATELAVARFVAGQPDLQAAYSQWLITLHEEAWKEVRSMARASEKALIDVKALVEFVGLDSVIEQVGLEHVIDEVGLKRVIDHAGLKRVIDEVGLKRVIDEVGLKRVIDEVGLKRVIDEVGLKRVIDEVGLKRVSAEIPADEWIASLSPAQRREYKRRLK
jgi:hypothetical protein